MNSKVLIPIGAILIIAVFVFFLVRNEVNRKTEIEATELTLSLGQITKEIYREKGVYVEIFIEKGKKKYAIDLDTKEYGVNEDVRMKITPFFSQEKINALTAAAGGNLKESKEIAEILKYSYQKVKNAHPEVPELYGGSIKIIPANLSIEKKMQDIDKQLISLEQRLKVLQGREG